MSQPNSSKTKDFPSQAARSHGRGGAGNINSKTTTPVETKGAVPPRITSDTYPTGRGGRGNMAKNDPLRPEETRAAQDFDAPPPPPRNEGTFHYGRGGEGNMVTIGASASGFFQSVYNMVLELAGFRKSGAAATVGAKKDKSAAATAEAEDKNESATVGAEYKSEAVTAEAEDKSEAATAGAERDTNATH